MGTKSKIAIASLAMGIACFLNLFGIEKALAAIVFGWLGLKEAEAEQKTGKRLAYAGMILGSAYIVTIAVLLVIFGPEFMEHIGKMKG